MNRKAAGISGDLLISSIKLLFFEAKSFERAESQKSCGRDGREMFQNRYTMSREL